MTSGSGTLCITMAEALRGTLHALRDVAALRTFAPKNFPRTDFFKTLTVGRK